MFNLHCPFQIFHLFITVKTNVQKRNLYKIFPSSQEYLHIIGSGHFEKLTFTFWADGRNNQRAKFQFHIFDMPPLYIPQTLLFFQVIPSFRNIIWK